MSDQEVKGKKSLRGRSKNKTTNLSCSSGVKDNDKNNGSNQRSAGSKKSANKKKGSSSIILKLGCVRGRIRIEDTSSDEEIVPKVEPISKLETNEIPVEVKQEKLLSSELEEKVSDENYINRFIKTEKFNLPEINHLSLIHTKQTSSLIFKDDLVDDITPSLSFGGPRANIPLHKNKPLAWNHKVNLIGDKCPSPRIHICEKCERPILLYGRLIPCKHVFCYDCAKANPVCLRCTDKVARVEKNKLGAVFMCSYDNCRRTYLSHRDLQAHVSHRHLRRSSNQPSTKQSPQVSSTPSNSLNAVASPSTSIGSSTLKGHSFTSRSKINPLSGMNFTHISSRATNSSIPMSFEDSTTIGNNDKKNYSSYLHHHQTNSKIKLPNNKNLIISGKSPNLTSQSLANLHRNWSTSGQPTSTISSASSSSFTSPTLPSSLTTSSWNLPLLSDPRQSSTINRHFYQ